MSASVPSRRLLLSAISRRTQTHCHACLPLRSHHRTIFGFGRKGAGQQEERRKIDPTQPESIEDAKGQEEDPRAKPRSGGLAPSIFDRPPVEVPQSAEATTKDGELKERVFVQEELEIKPSKERPDYRDLTPTLSNPDPRSLVRWERKMVIRDIRGRHRLNKTEKILRTERFHVAKSPIIKTSVKKLGPLARQIAGKPVDEALVQMRYSKKKAALDVLKHLKYVRDQAIVHKQMGLGKDYAPGVDRPLKPGEQDGEKTVVVDKKGKRRTVTDRSAMYVDEAWVGRGPFRVAIDYRARGASNRLMRPYTSISIVLKEEATRIRQQEEREQKRLKRKVWVPLPDRPITAQRQYPLW